MRKFLVIGVFALAATLGFGQKYTISGTLTDAENGEDLFGATVLVVDMPGTGAVANAYGFYSLTLPAGKHSIRYQYIGFVAVDREIDLQENIKIDIELGPNVQSLGEVEITGERADEHVRSTEMSIAKLSPKDVETIPVLFGEKDLMKTAQLLPGIKTAGEGNSGIYVRGGGIDQNLILLDEAPVYNASHLLGFFSVFNSDAIKDMTIYKGGMPAEYGGRASSVIDIKMKEGNNKKMGVTGGIGLISSKLTLESPIVRDKGSVIISGRRTYADYFLRFSKDTTAQKAKLYFYDLNLKANYKFGEKDRVFISGYFGRDNFGLQDLFGFDWGNATGTARWNHLFSDKLFLNSSLIYSDYGYKFSIGAGDQNFAIESKIRDLNLKEDFSLFANSNNTVKFGLNAIYHTFVPGKISGSALQGINLLEIEKRYAVESGVYIQNDQKINERLNANYGLRYSMFNYLGPGTAYTFDEDGEQTAATMYPSGEIIKTYGGLEPRLSLKYQLDEFSSVKTAYNRNYQYLHLLSNSTTSSPTDIWVPSSNNVKPQIADQIALGYFRNLKDNTYEASVEVYYKGMQNQIDYKNGADLLLNSTVESELVYGKGQAYGAEFFVKKRTGRLTGWVSYTLSRTFRIFDDINGGLKFPARQDRIHDIAIVGMFAINDKWSVSANWVYYTGNAVTFPSGRYVVDGLLIPYYTERNGYRMPDYHRLDLGATWTNRKTEKFESSWSFSIYNAYNRENAYSINFRQKADDPTTTEAVQLSLFKIIPAFSYNFKF